MERSNLLNTAKLAIKSLIETSMASGITSVDDSNDQLRQFFVVMEHVLQHGIKQKRSNILGQKRSFFAVAEAMERYVAGSGETLLSVRNMPSIRTSLGRARAWLRLVVMQKKLGDFARELVDRRDVIEECYEDYAFLASDDASVISGMLLGLSVLDCNLDIRREDLDNLSAVIDFSRFLKEGNYLTRSGQERSGSPSAGAGESTMSQGDLSQLLDQKAYLEEMNTKLTTSVDDLQSRLSIAQKCNDKLQAELDQTASRMNTISEKHEQFVNTSSDQHAGLGKKLEEVKKDIDAERQTYESARQGLNEMYTAVQKQLETEIKMREELEREIELQRSMKGESETAMQLMETAVHEKQDTITSLRRQLDDVKKANLAVNERLQTSEETGKAKTSQLDMLTISHTRLTADSERLQTQVTALDQRSTAAEDTLQQLSTRYADLEVKKASADADLVIERQWRSSVQTELEQERTKLQVANGELEQLRVIKTQFVELQRKYADLQELCSGQEQTLVELGSRLQLSKQEAEDMRERSDQLKQSAWADDKQVTSCRQCGQGFSVARRKHHCRQCGMIYCNACSDNQMVLAASSKPVRVCDHCYTLLLQPTKSS